VKTTALIEKGKEGTFCIYTPDLHHNIVGEGKREAEAKSDFENSVKEVLVSYTETEHSLPAELLGVEFEYRFDIVS